MRRFLIAGILLAATGATGPRAMAETGTRTNPHDLPDTIVVTANRVGTSLRENANSITVITREQIETSQAVMVSDLLRTAPGLDVVQSGGLGQQTAVFLRGANSEHVLVLMDGVELNDPSSPSSAANLANIPLDNIERIEVLRGPQSVLYGSDAIAGVIQIFTKQGGGKPTVKLSTEAGAFGSFQERLDLTGGQDRVDYSLSVARRDSEGTTAAKLDGDGESDGYESTSLSFRGGWSATDKLHLNLSGRWTDAEAALDQNTFPPDDNNYNLESTEKSLAADISYGSSNSPWTHKLGVAWFDLKRVAVDGIDVNHPADTSNTEYLGNRLRVDWQYDVRVDEHLSFTAGTELENESLEQSLYYGSVWGPWADTLDEQSVRTTAGYALARISLAECWYTTLGGRYDDHEMFGGETTFRLTSTYLLNPYGLKFSATFGTGFKAPTLYQLYDNSTGNPDLLPETSRGWELGLEYAPVGLPFKLGGTSFRTEFTDLIQFDGVMVNKASATTRGVELYGETGRDHIRLRLDYTYTKTRNDEDGSVLIRRPRHKLGGSVYAELTSRVTTSLRVSHVGRREDTDFNVWPYERVELESYTLVDLGTSWQVTRIVGAHARLENLLDEEYEEALGYASRPISLYGGITLSL